MRLLLDTHAFLWFITNDSQLSAAARVLIADPSNEILVSPASYWEIAIKVKLGKYPLSVPYLTLIQTVFFQPKPSSLNMRIKLGRSPIA